MLEALHGAKTGEQILTDLCKWMNTCGSLATLRHGFKCYRRTLRAAFFKAAHGLNPELEERYAKNRVGITRQLHFSAHNEKSLDVTLSVNGRPSPSSPICDQELGERIGTSRTGETAKKWPSKDFTQTDSRNLVRTNPL